MEASWSPCLPGEGRWDLLFVQICARPQPCPAHRKCVMKAGRALCTVQLPVAGLELITAPLLRGLGPFWGEAMAGSCHSHAAKLPIHSLVLAWHFCPPSSSSSSSPIPPPQSSHRSVAEALEQRSAGPHPRSSPAFLGEAGGLLLGLCHSSCWQQHHSHQLAGSFQIKISGAKHISLH